MSAPRQVNSLGLYTSFYLVVLGATYAILPAPTSGFIPGGADARGVLYVALGLALLWAAIEALSPRAQRLAYAISAALIANTGVDLAFRGAIGAGAAHASLGVALLLAALFPRFRDETRAPNLLGVTLGGTLVLIGADALLRPSGLSDLPSLGITAAMVGAVYVFTGSVVVWANVRPALDSPLRRRAHLAAGCALALYGVLFALTVRPDIFFSAVAMWFRAAVTAFLPRWERVVRRADVRTLRARTGAAFATLATIASLVPLCALVLVLERVPGYALSERGRLIGLWAALMCIVLATVAGVTLASRLSAALRRALEPGEATDAPEAQPVAELADVVRAIRTHVQAVGRLERETAVRQDQVSGVGHDLRSPLAAITTAAQLLQQDSVDADRARKLGTVIGRQAAEMGHLIENLVEAARLESGEGPTSSTAVAVGPWFEALRAHFALHRGTDRLTFVAADATARADPHALHRIAVNLVENALKYSPANTPVTVRATCGLDVIQIAVVDHGPGIPVAERARVFERYYRSPQAGRAKGFGLGLHVSHLLAQRMGGRVSIEETPGGGATFTLALPIYAQAEAASSAATQEAV